MAMDSRAQSEEPSQTHMERQGCGTKTGAQRWSGGVHAIAMRNVALEVPCAGVAVGWARKCDDPGCVRAEVSDDTLDGAILSGCITSRNGINVPAAGGLSSSG